MTQAVQVQGQAGETTEQDEMAQVIDDVRARLTHVLKIFPFVSSSMLQSGVSPGLPPKLWRPILQRLIEEGVVSVTQLTAMTPGDRTITNTIYHLTENPYTFNQHLNPSTQTSEPEPEPQANDQDEQHLQSSSAAAE